MTTLLIDATNMAHRARHAYNLSLNGRDTSVTFGFMRMLMALCDEFEPEAIITAWDGGTPKFRKQYCLSYKANRHKDEDPTYSVFLTQIDELMDVLPHYGILNVYRKGVEADDLLKQASLICSGDAIVVSTDNDMLQTVSDTTQFYKPGKESCLIRLDNFYELTGCSTIQELLIVKAFAGDGSDNIKGVKGMGDKTTKKFLDRCDIQLCEGSVDIAPLPYPIVHDSNAVRGCIEDYFRSGEYERVYKVIDLTHDRTGSRSVLLTAPWVPYSHRITTSWCLKHGFSSFITEYDKFGKRFGNLKKPLFKSIDLIGEVPRIWDYTRYPQ